MPQKQANIKKMAIDVVIFDLNNNTDYAVSHKECLFGFSYIRKQYGGEMKQTGKKITKTDAL